MANGTKSKGRWRVGDFDQNSNSNLHIATANFTTYVIKRKLFTCQYRQYLQSIKTMSDYEVGKKAAAIKAVESHIKSGDLVGIGSGSTIVYAVDRLAELVSNGTLTNIQCVPTSFQVRISILEKKS